MTMCIKTGAYVYLEPYGAYTPADLYELKPGFVVLRLNPDHQWLYEPYPGMTVTHHVSMPDHTPEAYFFSSDKRTLVVPILYVSELSQ